MATATKADLQGMSRKERLWEDLSNKYSQQREESNAAYDKAFSQTGNELLKRGMGRSSYGAQTQANVLNEKNKAADKIYENQIAAYASGLNDLEAREAQERYQEGMVAAQMAQVEAQREATAAQLEYQKSRDAVNDARYTSEWDAKQAQQAWENQFNENQAALAQSNIDWEHRFKEDQATAENNRWIAEFNHQGWRDSVADSQWNQQYYGNWVQSGLAAGNDPTDNLLSLAGLSREDANSMKTPVATGGGGGGYTKPKTENPGLNMDDLNSDAGGNIWNGLNNSSNNSSIRSTTKDRGQKLAKQLSKKQKK